MSRSPLPSLRRLARVAVTALLVSAPGVGLAQSVARFSGSEVRYLRACGPRVTPVGATEPFQPEARTVTVPLDWDCFGTHAGAAEFRFPRTIALQAGTTDRWTFDEPARVSAEWSWGSPASPGAKEAWLFIAQIEGSQTCQQDLRPPLGGYPPGTTVGLVGAIECPTWTHGVGQARRFDVAYYVKPSFGLVSGNQESGYQDVLVRAYYTLEASDLEVKLSWHAGGRTGESPVWRATVTNRGDAPAPGSELRLGLVAGGSLLVSPLDGCAVERKTATCHLGTIEPGTSRELLVESTVPDRTFDSVSVLEARVTSTSTDANPSNDYARSTIRYTSCHEVHCLLAWVLCDLGVSTSGLAPAPAGLLGLAFGVVRNLADAVIDVDVFHRLRDDVLAPTAAGRRYRELFYSHTREVTALAAADPSLAAAIVSGILEWQPLVRALVTGEGAATARIGSGQITDLLDVLARLESHGSPELAAVLARERAALDLPSLAGKTVHEALARLQTTAPLTVTIPAAASIHGLAPAFFHSDLRVLNPAPFGTLDVTARYRCFTGPCPAVTEKTFPVRGRELRVFEDAVVSLFAAPETAGAIELTGAVLAESRVYTPSLPAPTSGSDVPGLPADEAYPEAVLLSLSRGDFRTNVGIYNPSPDGVRATVWVHAPDGAPLGELARDVGGTSAVQVNDVFGAAGVAGDVRDAYAIVKADGVRPLFAYATVIDNRSQDSVFVKGRNARAVEPSRVTVPAAASIHGVPPAFFHSDVRVFNPSPAASATVTATYRCFTGACPADAERSFAVGPREMKVLDDVVASLFGAPETAGAIELEGNVHVESRVYTPERSEPTTGTSIPGQAAAEATTQAVLLSLSHSATAGRGFRTNVGVYNPHTEPHSVTISLRRPDGTQLASLVRTVPASLPLQVNDVFGSAGVTADVPAAWALVTGDGARGFFAYATVIDNQSQDSVFVKGRALLAP